ncbi:MAG: hypothetical protein E7342_04120, partial [Clostridiales bacterium]|nr:hypothetical protein [Clostridiales bacterium]
MKAKFKNIIALSISLVLIVGAFFAGYFVRKSKENEIINWVTSIIGENYTLYDEETGEYVTFTEEDYARAIVDGLLDKYSFYFNTKELTNEAETKEGKHYGIGVSFWKNSDILEIATVSGNSPAEKAGMVKGEVIIALKEEGKEKVFITRENYSIILGEIEEETPFTLYTLKNGVEQEYVVEKRAYIESFVKYYDSEMELTFTSDYGKEPQKTIKETAKNLGLDENTAYVEFTSFSGNAGEEMITVMEYFHAKNKTKLILDLRNNGGGYMDVLQKVASCFFRSDKKQNVVAYVKYKDNSVSYYKTSENNYKDMEIVVLANKNTASASECLIGAMISSGSLTMDNFICEKRADGSASTYGKGRS